MKKITIILHFLFLTLIFSPLSYSQTLAGSSVTFVELASTVTVVDGDASVPGEFLISANLSYDIDATQIIFSFRNSSSINQNINFTFSGGTVTGITSITVNSTQSSVDVSSITSSIASSGIGVTINTGTATVAGSTYGQIVFDLVVEGAAPNNPPVIAGTSAGQAVNDNSTLLPFSTITTTDADGDNLSATITLDDNAKGVLSGTDLTGTGPYAIASTTPADLQAKLRALSFNPTDNRTNTSETTTFTVVVDDGAGTDTNNTTTVISSAVAPVINEVNSFTANGTYGAGSDIIISVTFSENVNVTGTPQITLETGTTDRTINYNGTGSGSNTLLFTYTVQAGDQNIDLDYVATNSLTAGTSIQDTGGSDATLTLATPGAANSLGANKAIVIDGVTPNVTSVTVPSNGTYTTGQNLDFTVNFNENITVVTIGGTPQIAITIGSTVRQAVYVSGSGSSPLLFRYTVQVGNLDTDGIAIGTLAANGGTLRDAASNDANLTLNSVGATSSVFVGNPTITWTGTTNNDWNTASNWDLNFVPTTAANVIIPNGITNYPTITSAVTVDTINIASGASLIANASVTANVTYHRNIPTTNWYLTALPFLGETQQDFIANHSFATGSAGNIGVSAFNNEDETGNPWIYLNSSSTGSITPGYGISIKLTAPGDLSTTGSLITVDYDVSLSRGSRNNFNLLGNPYTSYIFSATLAGSNAAIDNATFWFWDGTQYVTHNNANPIEIAPAQGFFVEANAAVTVTYFSANQSHQSSDTFMRQEPNGNFELHVTNGEKSSSTKVFYIEGTTTGHDNGYDSKMFGGTEYDFALFTELITGNEGDNLAIQTLPTDNTEAIPLGLIASAGEEVTFSIEAFNLPEDTTFYLEDKSTGEFTNLSEEAYTTTLESDANGIGQFYIVTAAKSLSTEDITANLNNVSIYASSKTQVTIAGLNADAEVSIFSLLGKQVVKTSITTNAINTINLPTLSTGVYVVKLNSQLGEVTKKITLN